ncbi:hypothetical protein, partial [Mesomycoplasma ovipneumoniae]|uniref:hypothetical protein n=1 Tax=Mesomycoplasma ovipneumoniae TaxID=29562 RepID=UPI00307FFC42
LLYEVNYLSKFFKMNMLEKINKSGAIKIIEKKLIVWDFYTNLTIFFRLSWVFRLDDKSSLFSEYKYEKIPEFTGFLMLKS